MTTFLAFLDHLTALDWLFIAIGWLLVAYALGTFTGLGIGLADKRKPEPAYVDVTLWLPPVPTQADVDATWLDAWPLGNDDETRLRFDQIVSAEDWAA